MDLATLDPEKVRRLVDGGADGVRQLVAALAPYVRARVGRVVKRRGREQLLDDLCQETFVELFDDRGRTLKSWDPARGVALSSFAQIVAERVALSILRSGRRSGWREEATEDAGEDQVPDSGQRPDRRAQSRELLMQVLDRLKEELSPRGYELFRALFVEDREVEAICAAFAMKPDAVYAWKSRLGKRVRALLEEIDPPSDSNPGTRTSREEARG